MTPARTVPLAIIIPAFRARYFAATLQSLADQTCREFRVYVADDASPEPIAEIAARFAGAMDLVYQRFATNLGQRSLVGHWDRAIKLSGEPYVWLFSDDDLMGENCVAKFIEDLALVPESRALRRLDLHRIGADGALLLAEEPFPAQLSGADYVRHLLHTRGTTCVMQNMIFPRAIYEGVGSFPDFPGGYCADSAGWPQLAREGGVRRLAGAVVRFREHGASLTVSVPLKLADWRPLIAAFGQTFWSIRSALGEEAAATAQVRRAEISWFCRWFRYHPREATRVEVEFAKAEMHQLWPEHPLAWRIPFWLNRTAARMRRDPLGHRVLGAWRKLGVRIG